MSLCGCSLPQSCPTLCDPMDRSTPDSLSFTVSWSLLKLSSIESVMPSNHLILCCPLLLLPSTFPSIRVFSNELALLSGDQSIGVTSKNEWVLPENCFSCCFNEFFLKKIKLYHYKSFSNESAIRVRWPKYWSFSSSISPSSDYSGLISVKIDWFDLLAVQETFRNLFTGLIGRVPNTGKVWGQKEKKASEDEAVDSITDAIDMNLGKLWEMVRNREAWCAVVHGVEKRDDWVTEQQQPL